MIKKKSLKIMCILWAAWGGEPDSKVRRGGENPTPQPAWGWEPDIEPAWGGEPDTKGRRGGEDPTPRLGVGVRPRRHGWAWGWEPDGHQNSALKMKKYQWKSKKNNENHEIFFKKSMKIMWFKKNQWKSCDFF